MRLDRLYDVRWDTLKLAAFSWITKVQKLDAEVGMPPNNVLTGLGVTFLLACERWKLDPRQALEVCDRVLRRAKDVNPQFPRGIAAYLKEEFNDG